MERFTLTLTLILCAAGPVAQTQAAHDAHPAAMAAAQNTHADHQPANPAALVAGGLSDEQRAQYLNGEGMGMAKPAEMNHFPGPRHVLDNAEPMKLSSEQLAATRALFAAVQEKAKALGRELVDREDELDRLFQAQSADEARLKQLTAQIGLLQGELRGVHLSAHLRERNLLSAEQIRIYDALRNYIPGEKPAPATHQH